MAIFDWPSVESRAADDISSAVLLNAVGRNLVIDALSVMSDRWRWESMNDAEWDDLQSHLSDASEAIMLNLSVGTVVFRAGDVASNELVCDGTQYARVDYPVLYDRLAASYIVDADNFVVPDLIGRVAVGAGAGLSVGDNGGEMSHVLTESEMPSHTHGYTTPVPNVDLESPGAPDIIAAGVGPVVSTGSTGGGEAHNNMQPYEVLLPCIVAS